MLSFLLLTFILMLNAAPFRRVVVTGNYTMQANDDILGCQTSSSSPVGIVITVPPASTGNFIFCVTDETGHATDDYVTLQASGSDVFYPDGVLTVYLLAANWKTSCFYSDNSTGFHERRF